MEPHELSFIILYQSILYCKGNLSFFYFAPWFCDGFEGVASAAMHIHWLVPKAGVASNRKRGGIGLSLQEGRLPPTIGEEIEKANDRGDKSGKWCTDANAKNALPHGHTKQI